MGLCVASNQNSKMLQAGAAFARMFNNLNVFCPAREERQNWDF
jgi:hypothetical protein